MKTWEAIKELTINPDQKFQCVYGNDKKILLSDGGFINFERFYGNEKVNPSFPSGKFDGNVHTEEDWELVREPVDFMTAINSGKKIKSENYDGFHILTWYFDNDYFSLNDINGKWYIED